MVALTDAAGTVVATYDYDAFGNHIATTGSVVNPYRYAGYRWDAETGLYYLNARYYAPGVGRFISRDAFHGFEDDPASLNQYNYAHSNPVMFVDPSGYFTTAIRNVANNFINWLKSAEALRLIGNIVSFIGGMAAVAGMVGLALGVSVPAMAVLAYLLSPKWLYPI